MYQSINQLYYGNYDGVTVSGSTIYSGSFEQYRQSTLDLSGSRVIGKEVGVKDVEEFVSKKIHYSVKEYGIKVPIFIEDVKQVVNDCFKNEPDNKIKIITGNRVEWKKGISRLLTLTETEEKEYSALEGQEASKYLMNLKARKKMEYANSIMSEATQLDIIIKIESAIEAIKSVPHDVMITRTKISEVSKLSYKTVCKYLDAIPQLKDCEVVDGRTEAAIRINELLENTCLEINKDKEKITKIRLHNRSKVSRPTIDKKLKDDNLRLKQYIDKLNAKIK